jgi:hypothetical protein
MSSSPPVTPVTLTARRPEDLLAVVPVMLGFVPSDSVAMLTFGAPETFHARVDLPDPHDHGDRVGAEIDLLTDSLLAPAVRHGVRQVVFVLYTASSDLADRVAGSLLSEFLGAGIDVLDALRADGHRWFPLVGGRRGVPPEGVAYDVSAHPFLAQAVLSGRVTHSSRGDLAALLRSDREAVRAVEAVVVPARSVPEDVGWVGDLVGRHVAAGTVPGPEDVARLLHAVADVQVRDVPWVMMTRADSPAHVEFWTGVLRRAPERLVPAPAALLGFAAWLSGHGALAWCALDRCAEVDPRHRMAAHVAALLTHAVPPSAWEELEPEAESG